jgi:predicted Zn-ribbon and HTH transcriptional regulator
VLHSAEHVVRPTGPEVADILRDHAYALKLNRERLRAMIAIVSCRTARLGGHIEKCKICGFERNAYNSCRNRQCPKCQILKQELWAEAQERRLLPIVYFHAIFTVAGELRPLFRRSPKTCLTLLFETASETLVEVAERNLHLQVGFTAMLHTWNQKMRYHPHVHFIVPGGGLTPDGSRFVVCENGFLLPAAKLRRVFKGKLLDKLKQALRSGKISFSREEGERLIRRASRKKWGVKIKLPLDGPRQVVRYLSRYVHRVAIANSRIVAYDGHTVTFRYKDRADDNKTKTTSLEGPAFAWLFLQHVLPDRFVRIRHYGFVAARAAKRLELCRRLLGAPPVPRSYATNETWDQAFQRIFHRDPLLCPRCKKGRLVTRLVIPPLRL